MSIYIHVTPLLFDGREGVIYLLVPTLPFPPVFWNFEANASYNSTLLLKNRISHFKSDTFSFKFNILIWTYSSLLFHLRHIIVYITDF